MYQSRPHFSSHGSSKITSYCNADWASFQSTIRSIFGYYVFLESSLISWKSNKQAIVSCSCVKAEYRAIAAITGELTWLRYLLGDLCIEHPELARLFCDNQAAIHIVENSVFHDHKSAQNQIVILFEKRYREDSQNHTCTHGKANCLHFYKTIETGNFQFTCQEVRCDRHPHSNLTGVLTDTNQQIDGLQELEQLLENNCKWQILCQFSLNGFYCCSCNQSIVKNNFPNLHILHSPFLHISHLRSIMYVQTLRKGFHDSSLS